MTSITSEQLVTHLELPQEHPSLWTLAGLWPTMACFFLKQYGLAVRSQVSELAFSLDACYDVPDFVGWKRVSV